MLEEIYSHCSQNRFLKMAVDIARYHHNSFQNKGHQEAVQGEDIPLSARIVRIAGDYDNLKCGEYKNHTVEEIVEAMRTKSGTLYDPEIIDIFAMVAKQMH